MINEDEDLQDEEDSAPEVLKPFKRGPGLRLEEIRKAPWNLAIAMIDHDLGMPRGYTDRTHLMESNRGQHKTMLGEIQPNGDRAVGPFQIMGTTHANIQKKYGVKFERMDPRDALEEFYLIARENVEKFGSTKDAAMAYHGGWDKKNWGPLTRNYGDVVFGDSPIPTPEPGTDPTGPQRWTPRPFVEYKDMTAQDVRDWYEKIKPTHLQKEVYPKGKKPLGEFGEWAQAPRNMAAPESANTMITDAARRSGEELQKESDIARNQPILEWNPWRSGWFGGISRDSVIGASVSKTLGSINAGLKYYLSDVPELVDPEYLKKYIKDPLKYEAGLNEEQRLYMRSTTNEHDRQDQLFRIATENEDAKVIGRETAFSQFIWGSVAEGFANPISVVLSYATPIGMAKLGYGAGKAVKKGMRLAAGVRIVAEGAVNEAAFETVEAMMGKHTTVEDVFQAGTGGALLGLLGVPGVVHAAGKVRAKQIAQANLPPGVQMATTAVTSIPGTPGPKGKAQQGPQTGLQGPAGPSQGGGSTQGTTGPSGASQGPSVAPQGVVWASTGNVLPSPAPLKATPVLPIQQATDNLTAARDAVNIAKQAVKEATTDKERAAAKQALTTAKAQEGMAEDAFDLSAQYALEQAGATPAASNAPQPSTKSAPPPATSSAPPAAKSRYTLLKEAKDAANDVVRKYTAYRKTLNNRDPQAVVDAAEDAHKAAKEKAEKAAEAYTAAKDLAMKQASTPRDPVEALMIQEEKAKESKAFYLTRALDELGDEATTEELSARADELQAQDIEALRDDLVNPLPVSQQIGTPTVTEAATEATVNPPPKPAEGSNAGHKKEKTTAEDVVENRNPEIEKIAERVEPHWDMGEIAAMHYGEDGKKDPSLDLDTLIGEQSKDPVMETPSETELRLERETQQAQEDAWYEQERAKHTPEEWAKMEKEAELQEAENAADRAAENPETERVLSNEYEARKMPWNSLRHLLLVRKYGTDMAADPENPKFMKALTRYLMETQAGRAEVRLSSDGLSPERIIALGPGVHVTGYLEGIAKESKTVALAIRVATELANRFLPGRTVVLAVGSTTKDLGALGYSLNTTDFHIVSVNPNSRRWDMLPSMMHEIGHSIFYAHGSSAPKRILKRIRKEWLSLAKKIDKEGYSRESFYKRNSMASDSDANVEMLSDEEIRAKEVTGYLLSKEEYKAEQFIKYLHEEATAGRLGDTPVTSKSVIGAVKNILTYLRDLVSMGYLKPDRGITEFLDWVLETAAVRQEGLAKVADEAKGGAYPSTASVHQAVAGHASRPMFLNLPRTPKAAWDSIQKKFGVHTMPEENPTEQGMKIGVTDVIVQGLEFQKKYPVDPVKLKTITTNSVFNFATPGTDLASSDHPVSNMAAGILVEHTMGAVGRHITASIQSVQLNREILGNSIIEYQSSYRQWAASVGKLMASIRSDLSDLKMSMEFDRLVGVEIAEREKQLHMYGHAATQRTGTLAAPPTSGHPLVQRAADALQEANQRSIDHQVNAGTIGWKKLPKTSYGWMPHMVHPGKLLNATVAQLEAWHSALTDMMLTYNNMNLEFAKKTASRYIDHARTMAARGHAVPGELDNTQASSYLIYMALNDPNLGLTLAQAKAWAEQAEAASPGHTKSRLKLDLNKVHTNPDGTTFTMMDLFDTDHLHMLKNMAKRVAGEVALKNQGVNGILGLHMWEKAIAHRETPNPVQTAKDIRAFQQVSAELLNMPYGEQMPTVLEGVMSMNALANLGGGMFPQAAESFMAPIALGLKNGFAAIGNLPRMIAQIRILAKGGKLTHDMNPFLGTLEGFNGGGEFGTEGYKTILPMDSHASTYDTAGKDSVGTITRFIRFAGHHLSTVNLQRVIHAAQRRGVSEQIAKRSLQFIRDGIEDKALADMGFSKEFTDKVRPHLARALELSPSGDIIGMRFDKLPSHLAAQYKVAIDRGAYQIIQGAFIGEQGKWIHSNIGRMLTQFNHYSILAVEKQWGRNRAMHGALTTMAMALAVAPLAIPIYLTRLAINAIGRDDAEEYIEKGTSFIAMARGVMNYIGLLGLAPLFADGIAAMLPDDYAKKLGLQTRLGGPPTIGDIIPPFGFVDRGLQAAREIVNRKSAHSAIRMLPLSNTPWLTPAANQFRPEHH